MGRALRILALAAVAGKAAACDVPALQKCQQVVEAVLLKGVSAGKPTLCAARDAFEQCYITSGVGCDLTVTNQYKTNLELIKTQLSGEYGIECMGKVPRALPLSSGDSGSQSGSLGSTISGSTYGLLEWQWVFLCILLCCCCCGGGGGGAYYAMNMKPKGRKGKGLGGSGRRQDMQDYAGFPEAEVPLAPMAEVLVDNNGDGIPDAVVRGVDLDRDGIPDVLEGNPNAPAEMEPIYNPVPPQVPVVETQYITVQEEAPTLFGPVQTLFPGASSTIVTGAQQSYSMPTYSMPQQSYAAPTTTAQYMPTAAKTYPSYGAGTTYSTPAAASSYTTTSAGYQQSQYKSTPTYR